MIRALGYACVFLLLLPSCKRTTRSPYLEVRPIGLRRPPHRRQFSSKMHEVWVYVEDEALGVWEPPVPILASGSQRVQVIAGIRRNRISSDIIQYPFYETWEAPLDLVLQQTTVVEPVFTLFRWAGLLDRGVRGPWLQVHGGRGKRYHLVYGDRCRARVRGNASGAFYLDQQRPFSAASPTRTSPPMGPVRCSWNWITGATIGSRSGSTTISAGPLSRSRSCSCHPPSGRMAACPEQDPCGPFLAVQSNRDRDKRILHRAESWTWMRRPPSSTWTTSSWCRN